MKQLKYTEHKLSKALAANTGSLQFTGQAVGNVSKGFNLTMVLTL